MLEADLYHVEVFVHPEIGDSGLASFVAAVGEICDQGDLARKFTIMKDANRVGGCEIIGDSFTVVAAVFTLVSEGLIAPINPLEIRPTLGIIVPEEFDNMAYDQNLPEAI